MYITLREIDEVCDCLNLVNPHLILHPFYAIIGQCAQLRLLATDEALTFWLL